MAPAGLYPSNTGPRPQDAGRWTLEVEILKEALECSRPKSWLAYALVAAETIR